MPRPAPIDITTLSLSQIAQALSEQRLPPVESWNPPHCGDSEMRIARDGSWYHQGAPITRQPMVRLFASLLRREDDGDYVLVTPAEKLTIMVEDTPFVAIEVKNEGAGETRKLAFRLNTDDVVIAGPLHPLRFGETADGPHPTILVRKGLTARINRNVYYALVEMVLDEGRSSLVLWSAGTPFALASS